MIELEVNGRPQQIEATSVDELERAIGRPVPPDHGVCRIVIDGREMSPSDLRPSEIAQVRHVRVESAPLRDIASNAVDETIDWIGRICGVLESIANDYRLGRESDATGRLPAVADALQVLVHLLHHMHNHLPVDSASLPNFKSDWEAAQIELRTHIDGLAEDLNVGDPISLSDRVGYAIPRSITRFRELLLQSRP